MRSALVLALAACSGKSDSPPKAEPPKPKLDAALPEVDPIGFEPYDGDRADLVVTPDAIMLDGAKLLAVHGGDVAPEAKEGGAFGLKIDALSKALAAKHAKDPGAEWLVLAFDPRATYLLLIEVMFTAKQRDAGYKRFRILARAGNRLVQAPITLPDKAIGCGFEAREIETAAAQLLSELSRCSAGSTKNDAPFVALHVGADGSVDQARAFGNTAADPCVLAQVKTWKLGAQREAGSYFLRPGMLGPPDRFELTWIGATDLDEIPLGLFVTVTETDLLVWSSTGIEGRIAAPKHKYPRASKTAVEDVRTSLAAIAAEHWGHRQPERTRSIVVQAMSDTPIQLVAELFGAVRAARDGTPLFTDIQPSSGFE